MGRERLPEIPIDSLEDVEKHILGGSMTYKLTSRYGRLDGQQWSDLTEEQQEERRRLFEELSKLYQKRLNTIGIPWDDSVRLFINELRDYIVLTADAAAEKALKWFIQVCEEGMAKELGITVEELQEISMPSYWVALKEGTNGGD